MADDDFGSWLKSESQRLGLPRLAPEPDLPQNFLDMVAKNPQGMGYLRPPNQSGITFDEFGRPYDEQGNRIEARAEEPSLGQSLLNIAESPARLLVGAITEPINAVRRLAANSVDENGRIAIPNPSNPQNRQDVLTGILSLYGGNALNPAAAIPKGSLASGITRSVADREAVSGGTASNLRSLEDFVSPSQQPVDLMAGDVRGFRAGLQREYDVIPDSTRDAFWASSSPEVANTYAGLTPQGDIAPLAISGREGGQAMVPANFTFANPLVVDAGRNSWNRIPFEGNTRSTADEIAEIARERGHDGLVLRNVYDSGYPGSKAPIATTYAALKRGTVTSPLTGELLFSDIGRPSIAGAATAGQSSFNDDLKRLADKYGIPVQSRREPINYLATH